MKKIFLLIMMISAIVQGQNSAPVVSNVNFTMRQDGSKIVDITYDVNDPEGRTLFITVEASSDAGQTWSLKIDKITGDNGYGIISGTNKRIEWEAEYDNYNFYSPNVQIKISADNNYILSEEPEMITVEGGSFMMGSTIGNSNELPVHSVNLRTFKIAKYEVTQKLWKAVMGTNPSYFTGDANRPVESVSWDEIQQFIIKLNEITSKTYRLPTEAEWEYATRGGNQSLGYDYAGSNDVNAVAWYHDGNSGSITHSIGTKAPNELGLYDMSGNVAEWCQDWYSGTYYSISPSTNPVGPVSGVERVQRGGSWSDIAYGCRSAYRDFDYPNNRNYDIGFRLAHD